MKSLTSLSEPLSEASLESPQPKDLHSVEDRAAYGLCAILLTVSIALWFLAIRAPLDLDETGSYWQISAGISKIWARQFMFPSCLAYSYILWLWTKLAGMSEIALRIPSILAALAAVYVLYLSAREMFDRETALIAAVLLSLHPAFLFASIDIRPYAFEVLMINVAIFILIRLRHNNSNRLAVLFGVSAACIVWFQYLFAVILPMLALCFLAFKMEDRKSMWRQFGIAFAAFTVAIIPTIPGFLFLLRTRQTHVFDTVPGLGDLVMTLAPGLLLPTFFCVSLLSLLVSSISTRRGDSRSHFKGWQILLCVTLGVIPVLILYSVSLGTPIHVFAERYRLVSVTGITLCWAMILARFRPRKMRLLFCISLVAFSSLIRLNSPSSRKHEVPWKHAMEFVEQNASVDKAPVLICSAYIESDFTVMPLEGAKASPLFAPLSYYQLSVPVVPLPRDLNDEAIKVGSIFVEQARQKRERFLAVELLQHYKILEWLQQRASRSFTVRTLGVFDGFEVLEFSPRDDSTQQSK